MSREVINYLLESGIAEDLEGAILIEMNLGDKMRAMIQRMLIKPEKKEAPKPIRLKVIPYKAESVEPVGGSPYREYKPPKEPKQPTKPPEGFDEFKKRWGIKKV